MHGRTFVKDAWNVLADATINEQGVCYKHGGKLCPRAPAAADACIQIWIAGNVCTPWSSAGARKGLLDRVSLVNLVFPRLTSHYLPEVFVNECTPEYDVSVLKELLPMYDFVDFTFGPTDLGIPANRDRIYSVGILKSKLKWAFLWDSHLLKAVFGRSCVTDGTIFLRADAQRRADFMNRIAKQRAIPPRLHGGWGTQAEMSCGDRARLCETLDFLADRGEKVQFIDVSQSSKFKRVSNIMPRLMTRSRLYVTSRDTFVLPLETFCAQCFPWTLPEDNEHFNMAPFSLDVLGELSDCEVKHLAGNGMNLPCVGAVLMVGLLTCVFLPQ